MADIIVMVADGMATQGWFTLSKLQMLLPWWQMEWTPKGVFILLYLRYELSNRTSSHTRGRWYLPMFLFRDGLLTLYMKYFFDGSDDYTIKCWKLLRLTFSSDLRKPYLRTGKSLSSTEKYFCF